MKIRKVEAIPVKVPLKKPAESSHGLVSQQESLVVKMNSDVESALERVEAVRAEGKDSLQIRVDANEALDMQGAMETVKALAHLDVLYLEQPFPRHAGSGDPFQIQHHEDYGR
jgi:L-alanine-DL-glutamate epimerase-like enolase superfamily enzyme